MTAAADLERHIADLGLDEHLDYLLGVARPTIQIVKASTPVTLGCSKFGGSPDLPVDFKWPQHKLGIYRFIGQLNLSEVPQVTGGLPGRGLLSFFYAYDDDGNAFWGDPGYVRFYWFDTVAALKTTLPPSSVVFGGTRTLAFQLGCDLPPNPWSSPAAKDWGSDRDNYWELRCRLNDKYYLLGYPFNSTLAYDPTPGPEWQSLLTLCSDDELDWSWHDGDWLVTFIEEQRLRVGDFAHIAADAG